MSSPYSSGTSLARLLRRVEKGLFILGPLLIFVAMTTGTSKAVASTREDLGEESQALLGKKKWAEAAIVLRSLIRKDPRSASANADLAKALFYLGRREEALDILNQAIELNTGRKKDWLVEQSRVFSKTFEKNTTFQTYQDGVDLLSAEKFKPAREKFEQALSVEPFNVEILIRLGQSYLLDGDHDSAAERLKLARRLDPYESEIHLWLGRALQMRGELSDALSELRLASEQLKQSQLAPVWLADAESMAGQNSEAIGLLEQDVKANPMHVTSLIALANYKTLSTDFDQKVLWSARRDYQNALSRIPDYVQGGQRFESELGVELPRAEKELQDRVRSSLQKLESRLEAESST
jgi:tetratricopeptide (TPR) repeat protein